MPLLEIDENVLKLYLAYPQTWYSVTYSRPLRNTVNSPHSMRAYALSLTGSLKSTWLKTPKSLRFVSLRICNIEMFEPFWIETDYIPLPKEIIVTPSNRVSIHIIKDNDSWSTLQPVLLGHEISK